MVCVANVVKERHTFVCRTLLFFFKVEDACKLHHKIIDLNIVLERTEILLEYQLQIQNKYTFACDKEIYI